MTIGFDPNDPKLRANDVLPGTDGGPIESVKRAVIRAVREGLTGSSISDQDDAISVDFEYPLKEEQYPSIWIQFSFTKLERVGIAHEVLNKEVFNEGQPDEWVNWEPLQEWTFDGRVTLTLVGLTSLQRDRIADKIIVMLAFSRGPTSVITDPTRDTRQYRSLLSSLAENPYVSMGINSDVIISGGQSTTVGVPWQQDKLAYEDNYSFDVQGQFNILFKNDGTYTLKRIDTAPTIWNPHDWH